MTTSKTPKRKTTAKRSTTSRSNANKRKAQQEQEAKNQRMMYIVMSLIIGALVLVIGWLAFSYLNPEEEDTTPTTQTVRSTSTSTSNVNANTNSNSNSTVTTNTNTSAVNDNSNENANENENTNSNSIENKNTNLENDNVNDNENSNTNENSNDNTNSEDDSDEDGEKVTLYFPTSSSSCGDVTAVERNIELGDDKYGEIMIAAMQGPESGETGYVDGVPSSVGLRLVEYTSEGARITVTEGYNDLDACGQATVDAQLIETANAMFELPSGTPGIVVTDDPDQSVIDELFGEEDEIESNDNSNTEIE